MGREQQFRKQSGFRREKTGWSQCTLMENRKSCDPFLSQILGAPRSATFPISGTIYPGVGELNQGMVGQRKQEGEWLAPVILIWGEVSPLLVVQKRPLDFRIRVTFP